MSVSIRPRPSARSLQRVGAVIIARLRAADRFGRNLEPAKDERLGGLQQLDLIGIVADAELEIGRTPARSGCASLEFLDEAVAADRSRSRARRSRRGGPRDARPRLLQHLDGVVDPGRVRPRLDVESDRGGGDEQEDG